MLQQPEELGPNTFVLLATRRIVSMQTYGPKLELQFTYTEAMPKIAELVERCRKFYELKDGEEIKIAKYVPH